MTDVQVVQGEMAVAAVDAFPLSIPLEAGIQTPMGYVDSVPGLFVRVRLKTGEEGWGEVWCNFPRFGVAHRTQYIRRLLGPFLCSRTFSGPDAAWQAMQKLSNVLRLQSGESGPIANVLAGIDIALWDAVGKREKQPLWKLFGGVSDSVAAYASTGNPDTVERQIDESLERGFRAFKLKVWDGAEQHMERLSRARARIGKESELMADANSSWPVEQAGAWARCFRELNLSFLEEPIPVDAPAIVWQALSSEAPMPLAGGENMISQAMFDEALRAGALRVLQPDISKWGGFSGLIPLARTIRARGLRLCPHMFSGAPGLMATAHLIAASGCEDGMMEYGVEFNPLRDNFVQHAFRDGLMNIGDAPGLGLALDAEALSPYLLSV